MEDAIFPLRLEDILVGALCVWRLTHLLHTEDGPFAILARLRHRAATAFECFYCLSLWIALPFACLIGAGLTQRLLLWPALSGAACLLHEFTSRQNLPAMIYEEKEP